METFTARANSSLRGGPAQSDLLARGPASSEKRFPGLRVLFYREITSWAGNRQPARTKADTTFKSFTNPKFFLIRPPADSMMATTYSAGILTPTKICFSVNVFRGHEGVAFQ